MEFETINHICYILENSLCRVSVISKLNKSSLVRNSFNLQVPLRCCTLQLFFNFSKLKLFFCVCVEYRKLFSVGIDLEKNSLENNYFSLNTFWIHIPSILLKMSLHIIGNTNNAERFQNVGLGFVFRRYHHNKILYTKCGTRDFWSLSFMFIILFLPIWGENWHSFLIIRKPHKPQAQLWVIYDFQTPF